MRILLADDHPLFREGVKPVLMKLAAEVTLFEAKDYTAAFELAQRQDDLDLALLDLYMPGMAGADGVKRFRALFPHIPLVVLSAVEERDQIERLLACGALGFIGKDSSSEVILSALNLVLAGGVYVPPSLSPGAPDGAARLIELADGRQKSLSRRQIEVLRELAKGQNNRQIAQNLKVTEGTVKIHLAAVFRILDVSSRTEALLLAQKMGLGQTD